MRAVFKYLWAVIWEWDVCPREITGKCCEHLLNAHCVAGLTWVILFIPHQSYEVSAIIICILWMKK